MLDYCIQDTAVTASVLAVIKNKGARPSNTYEMELKLADLTLKKQELFGFCFDSELAKKKPRRTYCLYERHCV